MFDDDVLAAEDVSDVIMFEDGAMLLVEGMVEGPSVEGMAEELRNTLK